MTIFQTIALISLFIMGTWGTEISSNDTYGDIKYDFINLYDKGVSVIEITKKLITEYAVEIDSDDDNHNFWFAIANLQWECKALDKTIYNRVKKIIISGKDIELWKELNASPEDIAERQIALTSFLQKIETEKKTIHTKKVEKFSDSIFEKGDCLIFKLYDDDYCGIFVLEAEKKTKSGMNLIVVTDIKKSEKPTIADFESANVLCTPNQVALNKYEPKEDICWYDATNFKKTNVSFKKIGQLLVENSYDSSKHYVSLNSWDNLKSFQDHFYKHQEKEKWNKHISLKSIRTIPKKQANDSDSFWQKLKSFFQAK
ncbi:hypothetical protein [uncultured Kordia sp.]|uniref:hypothetical protein n=1 Tax=uncultured Kordia sp. TaxID=507699 RepID=UPI00260FFB44|nr:hypothetical protein [uncultured Kordia sp.]